MPTFDFSYITGLKNHELPPSLVSLIEQYNAAHPQLTAQLRRFGWNEAWQQLEQVAVYGKGPSISEVGSVWVNDYAGLGGLRPFQEAEIARWGGEQAFVPAAWQNCRMRSNNQVWAIPARSDVRMVYYWKDMLEAAGVDPATAFSTPQQFEETLARLQHGGDVYPWACACEGTRVSVFTSASWVWQAGGDFVDSTGRPSFHQPQALAGLTAYFNLYRYQHPRIESPPDLLFLRREAAVTVSGLWILQQARSGIRVPGSEAYAHLLGVALPPGPPFVGGTCFAIWRHTSHAVVQAALDLIDQLVHSPRFTDFALEEDSLPSQIAALDHPRLQNDPQMQMVIEGMLKGRTYYAATRLSILIADRLAVAMGSIWDELRLDPTLDVPALVRSVTEETAVRLEQTLARGRGKERS